jgi:hypothetical protein
MAMVLPPEKMPSVLRYSDGREFAPLRYTSEMQYSDFKEFPTTRERVFSAAMRRGA